MVKSDFTKDYYGILGLQSNAVSDEIKKAYHKLALKWHPDRNLGSEAEAGMKFQDISAAYEILVDSTTREKYDADRLRYCGKYSAFKSPTNNVPYSYTNLSRPTQPPRQERSQHVPPDMKSPPSGASQYARWTANQNAWAEANTAQPQSRAEAAHAFRAWGNMKAGATPGRGATPAERGGSAPGRGAPPPPNMASRGRPQPRTNTFAHATGSAGTQTTPKARAGWDQFESNAPPPGVTRSKTMRTPKKSGFDPGTLDGDEPPARNASAYYNIHRGSIPHATGPQHFHPRPAPPTSAQDPKASPSGPDPFTGFRSPRSEENMNDRVSTPYATSGGEKTYFSSEGLNSNLSSESASNLQNGGGNYASAKSSPRTPNERHRSASPRMRSPNPQQSSSSSDESSDSEGEERVKLRPRGFAARYLSAKGLTESKHMPPPPKPSVTVENPDGETFEFGKPVKRSTWTAENANGGQGGKEKLSPGEAAFRRTSTGDLLGGVRRKPSLDPTGSPKSRSPLATATPPRNVDDEDFEPLEKPASWQEKFGYKKDDTHRHFDPPVQCGPQPNASFANGSSEPNLPTKDGGADRSASQFSQQEWQQKFGDAAMNPFHPLPTFGPDMRGRASPMKPRQTPRKMSTASKRPNFPQPASVSAASSDSSEEVAQAPPMTKSASAGHSSNGSAMDIDSKTPPISAEMRSTYDPLGNAIRSQKPNITPTGSAAPSPTPIRDTNGTISSMKKDFIQSAPFTPSNASGLGNIGDLGDNLPFPSKPAATLPAAEIHPHKLALPNPPKAPKTPNTAALTRKDYDYYMVFVRKYMAEWNMFNQKMLAHFSARQGMIENNLPKQWLDSVGQEGYLRYMAWMQEDMRVRAHWDESYEQHIEAMKKLGDVKAVAVAGKWAG